MEYNTSCQNDLDALPLPADFSSINLKVEILDKDFCIDNPSSSKGHPQDFQGLDQLSFTSSLFNLGIGIPANGFYSFDPFRHDSSADFGLNEFKPCEESGSTSAAMLDLHDDGFLNFPDRGDSLMGIGTALKCHDSKPLCFVLPDEISCVTAGNLGCLKEHGSKRSENSIQGNNSNESEFVSTKRWGWGRKKSKSAKGQWTAEEDRLLIHLVEKYGVRKWSNIAQMLKGRIGKQCRERWHNHLRPDIKKDVWTEEEDRILVEVHAKVGNKWAEIAKSLPGRTENTIKNHWNATKRRQFTRRKCRTKWPRPSSLLQNYIKNLTVEKESSSKSRNTPPPTTTDSAILDNTTSASAAQKLEIEFCQEDLMVPEYDFNEHPEFTFDDDHLFRGSSMDFFMDDIPAIGPPPEIYDEPCFDVELPSDMPPLMQCEVKKELDFFDGNA